MVVSAPPHRASGGALRGQLGRESVLRVGSCCCASFLRGMDAPRRATTVRTCPVDASRPRSVTLAWFESEGECSAEARRSKRLRHVRVDRSHGTDSRADRGRGRSAAEGAWIGGAARSASPSWTADGRPWTRTSAHGKVEPTEGRSHRVAGDRFTPRSRTSTRRELAGSGNLRSHGLRSVPPFPWICGSADLRISTIEAPP